MIYIGVDPGLDGGLAAIEDSALTLNVMPTVAVGARREVDEQAVVAWILDQAVAVPCRGDVRIHIELVHAMPGQGVVSMFSFGTGWGLVRGICAGMGFPYVLVSPQEWKKATLPGQPKGSEYLAASRLWPNADWRRSDRAHSPHSGLVDAALIAIYGQMRHRGGG